MKVVVEASVFKRPLSGVGYYAKNLLQAVAKIDPANHYLLYSLPSLKKHPTAKLKLQTRGTIPIEIYSRLLMRSLAPPIDLALGTKANVFIFPNFVRFPLLAKAKSIVFIYDLAFLLHPQYVFPKTAKFLQKFAPPSARQADKIITISQNSKVEIIKHLQVPAEKVVVVYPGLDHQKFKPQSEKKTAPMLARVGINKAFILYSGNLEPRKNVAGIISAYLSLPPTLQQSYSLVLAGSSGWLDDDIKTALALNPKADIILPGFVTDEDLASLYSRASVFVYPSHYEGFGMPPLEAMACGCPVITSSNSALPEVVGQAALMLKKNNVESLHSALIKVLTDQSFAKQLSKNGIAQARKFSWEKSAKVLATVMAELAQPHR